MRKLVYMLPFVTGLFFATSCGDEDYRNPTNVVNEYMKEHSRILTSSDLGWRFDYYPNEDAYGAFNFLMHFHEDGRVDMLTDSSFFYLEATEDELVKTYGIQSSDYTIQNSQGPVLTFSTYSLLTKLADPELFNYGTGWQGENEFVIMGHSACKDTVYLKALRTQKRCNLVRNTQDWKEYFGKINAVIDNFTTTAANSYFRNITLPDDSEKSLFAGFDINSRTMYAYRNEGDMMVVDTCQLLFTPEGIKFKRPITIHGNTITGLVNNGMDDFSIEGIDNSLVKVAPNGRPDYVFEHVKDTFLLGIIRKEASEYLDYYSIYNIPESDKATWDAFEKLSKVVKDNDNATMTVIPNNWEELHYSLSFYDYYPDSTGQSTTVRAQCKLIWDWVEGKNDEIRFSLGSSAERLVTSYSSYDRNLLKYEFGTKLAEEYKKNFDSCFRNFVYTLFKRKQFVVVPSPDYQNFNLINVTNGECIPVGR